MRLPRMTTRRWMVAVVVVALATWAGLLTWRRQYYLRLAQQHQASAASAAAGEQLFRRRAESLQGLIEKNDREIARLQGQEPSRMSDLERQGWQVSVDLGKAENQLLRKGLEESRQAVEEFGAFRRKYEGLAEAYRAAAARPWAMGPVGP